MPRWHVQFQGRVTAIAKTPSQDPSRRLMGSGGPRCPCAR